MNTHEHTHTHTTTHILLPCSSNPLVRSSASALWNVSHIYSLPLAHTAHEHSAERCRKERCCAWMCVALVYLPAHAVLLPILPMQRVGERVHGVRAKAARRGPHLVAERAGETPYTSSADK
eukprot:1194368-Prorocentrum_minimum.AAC.10